MAGFYNEGLEGLLARTIPDTATFHVFGVNDDYVFSAAHEAATVGWGDSIILEEKDLASVTFTNGYLDALDVQWVDAGVGLGEGVSPTVQGVVVLIRDGATDYLFAFLDSARVGLPQVLTGVNVTAIWNAAGILRI